MNGRGSKVRRVFGAARQESGARDGSASLAKPKGRRRRSRVGAGWRDGVVKLLCGEKGQALVLTALSLTMLMGGMALAIDVGNIHYRQRILQTAADSAAIAAGLELGTCGNMVCNNMKIAAEHALQEDGMTTTTITPTSNCAPSTANLTGLSMYINVAPCVLGASDPNNGNANMAEVVLTQPQNTFFGGIFGMHTMNLVAHAEAGEAYINYPPTSPPCIRANSIEYNSNGMMDLKNCSVYDNGPLQTNPEDSATAIQFLVDGSWSPNNCNKGCSWNLQDSETQPTLVTSLPADPIPGLYPNLPTKPGGNPMTNINFSSNQVNSMGPGYYSGDVNLNSNVTVDMAPGLYYFDGSLNVDSNSTLECTTCTSGAGVTLYFNSGSLQANSNSTVELTASSTGNTTGGAIPNMLLWGGPGASNMEIDSNSQSYFTGIVYLPTQTLTLNSNGAINMSGTSGGFTMLDVNDLKLNANENLTLSSSSAMPSGGGSSVLGQFALAE